MMQKEEIETYLAAFARSPTAVLESLPPKRTSAGTPVDGSAAPFGVTGASRSFVLYRDAVRARMHDGGGVSVADLEAGKAPIKSNDHASDVVDVLRYEKPADMDAHDLSHGALAETPWSGDYWPTYLGLLGRRYADDAFPASTDWKQNRDYAQRRPAAQIVAAGDQGAIDSLSPAEKYDLLVGDSSYTLTAAMWAQGKAIYDALGSVESWNGICHGWAPAAYMMARPQRVVTARSPDGRALRFFPADIKGLASLLWASSSPPVRFIGTRDDEKEPKKDENGRVLSDAAFDTNPGTWHQAVVNQIAVAGRSFIMDTAYDYQVWNQPICGYEYSYFNPQELRFAQSLREATVARGDFSKDRFAKYRSRGYAAAAGVAMRTRYVAEIAPSHARTDAPSRDRVVLVDYFYDLELDRDGRILGGEWYVNRHPDFLWGPAPGVRAVTPGDAFATGTWDVEQPVPPKWQRVAQRTSTAGLPLAKIVEELVALASG
jgi:hypothetical protein